jgi:hypothetical protein
VGLVKHVVVIVLIEAEIHPDPVAETEQQLELGVVANLDAPLDTGRGPVERTGQVSLLGEQLG